MSAFLSVMIGALERGLLPDSWVRHGIRRLCTQRLAQEGARAAEGAGVDAFAAEMRAGPIAPVPEAANAQHYEVPPEFFRLVLGPRRKYSACDFTGAASLAEAEERSLAQVAERAELRDGQDVLELGCGWGSLTLWVAERFPRSRITGVSNSAPQRRSIEAAAAERGLTNVRVLTADMNSFDVAERFDRVVSIEMFEHMRNWEVLLARIAGWLRADGSLFVHVFRHARFAYAFETAGADNWLGRHFFTGGIMPSDDLVDRFARDLRVVDRWSQDGTHYQRTAEAWLGNLDARRAEVEAVLGRGNAAAPAAVATARWRVFFMACSELFGFAGGTEWGVSHWKLAP